MINKNEIRFNCPECGIPINVTLEFVHKEDGFSINHNIKNAEFIEGFKECDYSIQCSSEFFTTKNVFNPYKSLEGKSEYVPKDLFSPFIQSRSFLGNNLTFFSNHCYRIAENIEKLNVFERLNTLYYFKSSYFTMHMNEFFKRNNIERKVEDSEISKLENIYYFNIRYLNEFLKINEFSEINKDIISNIHEIQKVNKSQLYKCIEKLVLNDDLELYEKKIVKLIRIYISKFKFLIPAISIEYLRKDINKNDIYKEYTMRTCTFDDIRNIYSEVYENIIDIYDCIAMLNNIYYRNDYEKFKLLKDIKNAPYKIKNNKKLTINNLTDFKLLNKGLKLYYIKDDEEKFNKYMPKLENYLRNSLAHESWNYDEENQIIKYEDKIKGKIEEHSLLEYANECYNLFVKLISIYKILIDLKNIYFKNIKID